MADLKQIARRIFNQTLAAIEIPTLMQRKIRRQGHVLEVNGYSVDLRGFARVRVVAIGKAAHPMVDVLVTVLAPAPHLDFAGVVAAPLAPNTALPGFRYFVGGHPVPNAESWRAAEAILDLLRDCDERTLVIFLLSGGGSALVEMPLDSHHTLADIQQLHHVLVSCGASIDEINAVRKHISAVKGGRLTVAAGRATKL